MMLPGLTSRQSYVRKRYGAKQVHGVDVTDYTSTPSLATYHGSVQPGTGQVDLLNRDGAEIVYTIFSHPADDVCDNDLVTYAGKDYQVNGEPERWGTGILDHIVVRLSRWEG